MAEITSGKCKCGGILILDRRNGTLISRHSAPSCSEYDKIVVESKVERLPDIEIKIPR